MFFKMASITLKMKYYSQMENIKQAMLINPHSPAVYNLYGILKEFVTDDDLARKHYRAPVCLIPQISLQFET